MSLVGSLWRAFYTASCFAYVYVGGAILSLFYCPFLFLFFREDKQKLARLTRLAISKCFGLMLKVARLVGAFDVNVIDIEKVRNDKSCVLIANHPSFIDYVMLASIIPDLNCIVKKEMANNLMFRVLIRCAGYISNEDSDDKLDEIKNRLTSGDKILIFPEGTRTVDDTNIKLKRGVAHLALRAHCGVRVLCISCNEKFLTKNNHCFDIYPKKPVFTIVAKQFISSDYIMSNYGNEQYSLGARHLTKELRSIMQINLDEANKQYESN